MMVDRLPFRLQPPRGELEHRRGVILEMDGQVEDPLVELFRGPQVLDEQRDGTDAVAAIATLDAPAVPVLPCEVRTRKEGPGRLRITSKGQVTIPQAVRERTGLLPNTEVEFMVEGTAVRIVKSTSAKRASRGATAVGRLRATAGRVRMTTDEIMALTRGEA